MPITRRASYFNSPDFDCADEPIHKIGFIQSHGYLIGLSKKDYRIAYLSENCHQLFKNDDLLGKKINEIEWPFHDHNKPENIVELLNLSIKSKKTDLFNPYKVNLNHSDYNLLCHLAGDNIIIEIEPVTTTQSSFETQKLLGQIMLKLNVGEEDLNNLLQTVASELRDLLSFDRVMIYKFWEDWHGEVVAESKVETLEPFLGLHYPATDIPEQARKLYTKNLTRLIVDSASTTIPIISSVDTPLDLTQSQLRAVSPMHIEYLQNMQVASSYSISLIFEGKLWGLIACHHSTPQFIDYEKRKASQIISQYLSHILELKTRENDEAIQLKLRDKVETLEKAIREDWKILSGLTSHAITALDITNASGVALLFNEKIKTIGITPTTEQISKIAHWLSENAKNLPVFHTTCLSDQFPEACEFVQSASGILSVTISKELNEYIIWFKPEHITEVTWAGKETKIITTEEDGTERVSPRKSFEKWASEVRNTSQSWEKFEIESAQLLREKVLSILELKSNEIRRLNEKLNLAYDELDSFSYTLSHDLKTPLNTIRAYLEILIEEHEDVLDADNDPIIKNLFKNTNLMQEMISNILAYSKLSREQIQFEEVNLTELINDIKLQISTNKSFHNISINLPEECIVKGNKMMLYQVFLNLIDNGVKYLNNKVNGEVKIDYKNNKSNSSIIISDNGIGIDQKYYDKIFNLFSRIPTTKHIEGSGVGLAIVKRIVEKHKGKIDIDSQLGVGTSFTITLKN